MHHQLAMRVADRGSEIAAAVDQCSDVRMVERGEDAPFALETTFVLVAPARLRDLLERDELLRAVQFAFGQPDAAHAAAPEFAHDAVVRQLRRRSVALAMFGASEDVVVARAVTETLAQCCAEFGLGGFDLAQSGAPLRQR